MTHNWVNLVDVVRAFWRNAEVTEMRLPEGGRAFYIDRQVPHFGFERKRVSIDDMDIIEGRAQHKLIEDLRLIRFSDWFPPFTPEEIAEFEISG